MLRKAASVHLDIPIDLSNKRARAAVPNRTRGDAQREAEHRRVPEIEARLEETSHLRLEGEVIDTVQVHVTRHGCSGVERRPLPLVVLRIQQKVRADDGDAQRDDDQDAKHQQEETVHVINLVRPYRCEHKVRLDEDGSEREQTPRDADPLRREEPRRLGDGSCLLYTSPSPRDMRRSRMPSSA